MSKQSGWIIVATEGATVDGRTITASWINDMAELYSQEEYTALIWPEHKRSYWAEFDGKNWGTVDAAKAQIKDGKLRLFVKITANQYLLAANKDGQKLFTSIEPNLDFRGTGRCYLMGLAVTDSPASSGTTRLQFSMGEKQCNREYSQLEPFQFEPEEQNEEQRALSFFQMVKCFFTSTEQPSTPPQTNPEGTDVDEERLNQLLSAQFSTFRTELKEEIVGELEGKFNTDTNESGQEEEETPSGTLTQEQFNQALSDAIKPLSDQVTAMKEEFAKLAEEAPGQRPGEAGNGHTQKVEAL